MTVGWLKNLPFLDIVSGLEINGCPGAPGTEILRRAPRFLKLGARQAPAKNGLIYIRAPGF